MADLKSKRLIVLKGLLFLGCIASCAILLLVDSPSIKTMLLIAILIWSSARFYYFVFYVLHQYVDPSLKYAGILALIQFRRKRIVNSGTHADAENSK